MLKWIYSSHVSSSIKLSLKTTKRVSSEFRFRFCFSTLVHVVYAGTVRAIPKVPSFSVCFPLFLCV